MAALTTDTLPVRLINKGKHPLPQYATAHSAGLDLRANLDAPIMLANVLLGIYCEQSVWYKVTDRTRVAGTIALVGAALTLVGILALVPWLGHMGSAWATLIC